MADVPHAVVTAGFLNPECGAHKGAVIFPALLATVLFVGCAASKAGVVAPERTATGGMPPKGRLAAPSDLACDRNHLTSWAGVLSAYRREQAWLSMTIDTDWATTETLTYRYSDTEDLERHFRLESGLFEPGDWPKIESAPGKMRYDGTRVIAWVCSTPDVPPVIDWYPPRWGDQ